MINVVFNMHLTWDIIIGSSWTQEISQKYKKESENKILQTQLLKSYILWMTENLWENILNPIK